MAQKIETCTNEREFNLRLVEAAELQAVVLTLDIQGSPESPKFPGITRYSFTDKGKEVVLKRTLPPKDRPLTPNERYLLNCQIRMLQAYGSIVAIYSNKSTRDFLKVA